MLFQYPELDQKDMETAKKENLKNEYTRHICV